MEGKGRMKGMWLQHFLLQKRHSPGVPFISRRTFCPHKTSPAWHQPAQPQLLVRARHKCSKDVGDRWKGPWQGWQEVLSLMAVPARGFCEQQSCSHLSNALIPKIASHTVHWIWGVGFLPNKGKGGEAARLKFVFKMGERTVSWYRHCH